MKLLTTPEQFKLTKSRGILEFECEHCNKIFTSDKHSYYAALNPNHVRTLNYCSPKCKRFAEGTRITCICDTCGTSLERSLSQFEKVENHFCNTSCSAKFNNTKRNDDLFKAEVKITTKNKTITKTLYSKTPFQKCLNCENLVKANYQKYCSQNCSFSHHAQLQMEKFNLGEITSASGVKKHLLLSRPHKCEVCQTEVWMLQPVPLEADHIDGNSENNLPSNLRLICPNCHAQTSTYKAKNVGQGRHKRKLRYQEGKSY